MMDMAFTGGVLSPAAFIAQIIKLALPVSRWPRLFQALLYLSSFVIVILISTNYPNLICDGNRHEYMLWAIEDQINGARKSVLFNSLYIGGRSIVYSVILLFWTSKKRR